MLEGKIRKCPFSRVQFDKITVWSILLNRSKDQFRKSKSWNFHKFIFSIKLSFTIFFQSNFLWQTNNKERNEKCKTCYDCYKTFVKIRIRNFGISCWMSADPVSTINILKIQNHKIKGKSPKNLDHDGIKPVMILHKNSREAKEFVL